MGRSTMAAIHQRTRRRIHEEKSKNGAPLWEQEVEERALHCGRYPSATEDGETNKRKGRTKQGGGAQYGRFPHWKQNWKPGEGWPAEAAER